MPDVEQEPPMVTLPGGPLVPVTAFLLSLSLEERGITLTIDDNGRTLVVTPKRLVTADDVIDIRRHFAALVHIARVKVRVL